MTLYIMQHQPPVVLISEYWDCECRRWYTHPNHVSTCVSCGTKKEDAPNSRVEEVIKLLEETAVANRKIINLLEETR